MSLTERLARLISFDTQNPSGDEHPMVDFLAGELRALGATMVVVRPVGTHAWVYARFGQRPPELLINAHVDTVPANRGYSGPPHTLRELADRWVGIGTADTKGAIAAILEALSMRHSRGAACENFAVLFSGDEESRGTCMRQFLTESALCAGLRHAIACEPTGGAVGWRHRGIAAAEMTATSEGGHSSRADLLPSPIALLARAAVALDDMGKRHLHQGPAGFEGLCMNIAAIDGGLAFNVIPTQATLRMSLRPAPGADLGAVMREAESVARGALPPDSAELVTWSLSNANPPFQTRDVGAFQRWLPAAAAPVDLAFWTEAALLSQAGIDAVVFGPGHIEQAHAADEFVERSQLEAAVSAFELVFESCAREPSPS
jgi:acetylornithine deacetylase